MIRDIKHIGATDETRAKQLEIKMQKQMSDVKVGTGQKMTPTWLKLTLDFDELANHTFKCKFTGKLRVKVSVNVFEQKNQNGKDVVVNIDNSFQQLAR